MDISRVTEESDCESEFSDFAVQRHACSFDGCDKSFCRLDRLLQHQRVHTGERPYICTEDNCFRSYTRPSHLKRHIEQSHEKIRTPADVVICQYEGCFKTFVSNDNLKRHVAKIHEMVSKQYVCDVAGCNKTFSKKFQLRSHEYEHRGVEPFQCHVENCKKKFNQKSHLVRHLKSHEGYKCDVDDCKQVFEKWSLLRSHKAHQHKNVHKRRISGEGVSSEQVEKFVCDFDGCGRMYSKLSSLKHHVSLCHEGTLIFGCDVENCGCTFATKQKLQKHRELHINPPTRKKIKRTGARKKAPKAVTDEIQLSYICEGIECLNHPSAGLLEPLIPRPKDYPSKLFGEDRHIIEKLKRKEWRRKKMENTQLDDIFKETAM